MLIISTFPHYLSLTPRINTYNLVVALSATLSALWHWYGEPRSLLLFLDYFFAGLWAVIDLYNALPRKILPIIALNIIVFITNLCIKYDNNYWFYHSLWHLLSSAKCYYVSHRLTYYRDVNEFSSPYHA
jgi:hypothetical protein